MSKACFLSFVDLEDKETDVRVRGVIKKKGKEMGVRNS